MKMNFGANSNDSSKRRSTSEFIASVSQQFFNDISNEFKSNRRSHTTIDKSTNLPDLFKELWKETLAIFGKSLVNENDIDIVKANVNQMMSLLLNELNRTVLNSTEQQQKQSQSHHHHSTYSYGPIWDLFFQHNMFEVIYLWSLSYPEYLYELKLEQLCHYENLLTHLQATEQTSLLFHTQVHQPLFSLLNHCATHHLPAIENHMIVVLNQLCVCICKNGELLQIFFENEKNVDYGMSTFYTNGNGKQAARKSFNEKQQGPAKFLIFSLLIPYIHKEGPLGQQARDALLLIMQLSARNTQLAKYIVDSTDFCPILATGLSGLYSDLPLKLPTHRGNQQPVIRYLQEEDICNIPALNKFVNSLEFCNNVIQISHSLIAHQLLQYVYYGFLVPVIAPALTQDVHLYPVDLTKLDEYANCIDEIVAATIYMDLFLRKISETNMQRLFLKFLMYFKYDDKRTLLDTFISRINSNNKLAIATLMIFYTMIDLNSEDVIYKLIISHLIPCKHLAKKQLAKLKTTTYDINGLNAKKFLSLSTTFNKLDSNNNTGTSHNKSIMSAGSIQNESSSEFIDWVDSIFDYKEVSFILSYIEQMKSNFADYLRDAKSGISLTTSKTASWSHAYNELASESLLTNSDLECDPEEFLLRLAGLNSSTNSDDPVNADLSKQRLDLDGTNESLTVQPTSAGSSGRKRKTKPKRNVEQRQQRANEFYILSFDNELSESENESLSSSTSSTSSLSSLTTNATIASPVGQTRQDEMVTVVDQASLDAFLQTLDSYLAANASCLTSSKTKEAEMNEFFAYLVLNSSQMCQTNDKDESANENKNTSDNETSMSITNDYVVVDKAINGHNNTYEDDLIIENEEDLVEKEEEDDETKANETDIGPFMLALLTRLENFLSNSLPINFLLTGLIARLAYYPQLSMRSYLLNQSLIIKPSIKSLSKALATVKANINACSETYESFHLLYFKAKLCLVKRLIDLQNPIETQPNVDEMKRNTYETKRSSTELPSQANSSFNQPKKVSAVDRLLNIFFKPDTSLNTSMNGTLFQNQSFDTNSVDFSSNSTQSGELKETKAKPLNEPLFTTDVELDFNDIKFRFNGNSTNLAKLGETSTSTPSKSSIRNDDFVQVEDDWEDLNTRNIAYSSAIFDEFVKELAAICQEHILLTQPQ